MKYSEFIQKQVDFLKENPEAAEMNVVFANSDNRIEEMEEMAPIMGEFNKTFSCFVDKELLEEEMSSVKAYEKLNTVCLN